MAEMNVTATATELSMQISADNGLNLMVRKALARALENQEGHWRTNDKRDAKAVAEVACYMFLDEMKQALGSAEMMRRFARDSDTRPKDMETRSKAPLASSDGAGTAIAQTLVIGRKGGSDGRQTG